MVLVNSGFHTRKNFNNYPKFWHAYSEMFASPAVDRKCLEKKSVWRGATLLACPGRPCYQHAAVYGVFLYTVNWCTSSCLMCISVLLFSRFRFCLLRHSYGWSKKISFYDRFNDVFFLLGDSPASQFYVPTFWNTLFHHRRRYKYTQTPKRKNRTFRTWRKFEIKKFDVVHLLCNCPI